MGDDPFREEAETARVLLRRPGALKLFARIYSDAEPGNLIRSAVRIEVERRTGRNGLTEETALEQVLLRLAFDAPGVLIAAFSGDEESEEWLEECLILTAAELDERRQ